MTVKRKATAEQVKSMFRKTEESPPQENTEMQEEPHGAPSATVPDAAPLQDRSDEVMDASIRFFLTKREKERAENFARDRESNVSNLSDLCRRALTAYLEEEEPILDEAKKEMAKLRERMRR